MSDLSPYKWYGKVTRVVGLTIEAKGPQASVGELCYILVGKKNTQRVKAEVVGFRDDDVLLMPLHSTTAISPGCLVEATGKPLEVKVGHSIIGKVIDGAGQLLTGQSLPKGLTSYPTENEPPNPLLRPRIEEPLSLGVRAIDTFLTELAAEGIPNTGQIDYTAIKDQMGFGMTDNEFRVIERAAIQTELQNLISSMDGIRQANVMITLPEDSL